MEVPYWSKGLKLSSYHTIVQILLLSGWPFIYLNINYSRPTMGNLLCMSGIAQGTISSQSGSWDVLTGSNLPAVFSVTCYLSLLMSWTWNFLHAKHILCLWNTPCYHSWKLQVPSRSQLKMCGFKVHSVNHRAHHCSKYFRAELRNRVIILLPDQTFCLFKSGLNSSGCQPLSGMADRRSSPSPAS